MKEVGTALFCCLMREVLPPAIFNLSSITKNGVQIEKLIFMWYVLTNVGYIYNVVFVFWAGQAPPKKQIKQCSPNLHYMQKNKRQKPKTHIVFG